MTSYSFDLEKIVRDNEGYHVTIFKNKQVEIVAMSILKDGGIKKEVHDVTQFTTIVEGSIIFHAGNPVKVYSLGPGQSVIVSPGQSHEFFNKSPSTVKLYTVYSPSENHN
jgi:mannose-6-phosphate isomerase-like protein (cupin superfamily)